MPSSSFVPSICFCTSDFFLFVLRGFATLGSFGAFGPLAGFSDLVAVAPLWGLSFVFAVFFEAAFSPFGWAAFFSTLGGGSFSTLVVNIFPVPCCFFTNSSID